MLISTLVTILLILLVSNATCSNLNSYKPIYNPGLQTKFTKSPAETAKFRTFTLYGSISQDIKNWLTDTLHQFDINNKVVDYKEVESMEGNVVGDVVVCQFRQQQLGWGSCDAMKNLEEVIYFASKSRKLQYIIVLLEDGLPARTIEMQKFIHDFISVMELKLGLKLSLKVKGNFVLIFPLRFQSVINLGKSLCYPHRPHSDICFPSISSYRERFATNSTSFE